MRRIDRFDKYMKYSGLNDNKVTVQLGLTVGVIGKSRKEGRDLSDKVIEEILNYYTDINRIWLLTGEGEMLKGVTVEPNQTTVDDMIHDKFFQALERRDRQIDEMLAQQSRLISVIERMQGIDQPAIGIRKSPPHVFRPETE